MGVLVRRALLVVNPAARHGRRRATAAERALRARGVECDVVVTRRPGEGGEIAGRLRERYDAVFTLGGDGTAMEVVGALRSTGTPVGIIPGGTGNLIARTLGVPLTVRHAVNALLDGRLADVDLGLLPDGRCFAFAAGVGIDARMIELTPRWLKRRMGVLGYAMGVLRAVVDRRDFDVVAAVDGTVIERRASAVMVANFGAVLDDLLRLGPGIAHDDGQLDLCIFTAETFGDAARVLWRLFRKDFSASHQMVHLRGRHFSIATVPPLRWQADGELLGTTPFEVSTAPGAARLIVPERG